MRSSKIPSPADLWMKSETRCCSAPSELSRGTSAGQSSSDLNALIVNLDDKGRIGCPEVPFSFGLYQQFPMLIIQPLMRTMRQSRSRLMMYKSWYFTSLQKELCSPTSAEGWDLVIADSHLPTRCCPHVCVDNLSIRPVSTAQEVI